jgi:hypothetical protein
METDKNGCEWMLPADEPVECNHGWFKTGAMEHGEVRCIKCGVWKVITPPAPQAPRAWVGLTESKIDNLLLEHGLLEHWPIEKQIHAFVKAIKQALKEKNHE